MDEVSLQLARLGGVADWPTMTRLFSRAELARSVHAGHIVRDARGRYAVPAADEALRAAHALKAVVSHRSAALHWGWRVKTVPSKPDVIVPRKRRLSPGQRDGVTVHWADLAPDDVAEGRFTSPKRTLLDCIRFLPFDEALAVADSALRQESVTKDRLVELAGELFGRGAHQARRVAREGSELAANPFESVLRAIALDVPGLDVEPQVQIRAPGFSVQPDLVDVRRRVVLEADSFEWHGDRQALRIDSQRYNNLVVRGWRVLRFAWEDVMLDPAAVRRTLTGVADLVRRQPPA